MSEAKKRVPKRRFKEFLNAGDWEQCKLGDLAEIVRGASPRPISDPKWFDNDSNVGWLRIADVTAQDGRIRYLEQKISELGQEKTRVIKTPHLLLSIAATVGKPVINYVPTGVHDGFLIFLNPKFNILYAFWWLEMFREKWNKYGQPGSQVNLNSDLVKNQVINIPNEKEQEKISSFLESLDKIITLHQCKLDKLQATKKALLQEMFPEEGQDKPKRRFKGFTDAWEQRKLSEVVTINPKTELPDEFKYVDLESVVGTNLLGFKVIKKENAPSRAQRLASYGDVFYQTVRPYQRNNYLFENVDKDVVFSTGYAQLRSKLDSYFLLTLVQNDNFVKVVLDNCTGTSYPAINGSELGKITVQIPSNEVEANQIGKVFRGIDKSITLHQRKLDKLKNLKQAYLNEMFV